MTAYKPTVVQLSLAASLTLTACGSPMSAYTGRDPAMAYVPIARAGITDARPEFRTVFCQVVAGNPPDSQQACDYWLRRLDDEAIAIPDGTPNALHTAPRPRQFDLLIVSGVFAECLPDVPAFDDAVERLRHLGYMIDRIPVKGRASAAYNADIIKAYIDGLRASGRTKKTIVLAYSKGAVDMLTALDRHPDLSANIGAIVSFAGAVNGSPLADQYRGLYESLFASIPYRNCPVTDGGEMASLSREHRLNWMASRPVFASPALFSIVATPTPDRISTALVPMHAALSKIDPRNDGQILHYDAMLPGATLLGYVNADHFAIALPFEQRSPRLARTLIDKNDFPRPQLVEAAVLYTEAALTAPPEQQIPHK